MSLALDAAEEALHADEVPVGCVLAYSGRSRVAGAQERDNGACDDVLFSAVDADGRDVHIAARGANATNATRNVRLQTSFFLSLSPDRMRQLRT